MAREQQKSASIPSSENDDLPTPGAGRQRSVQHPRYTLQQVEDFARRAFELGARGVSQDRAAEQVGYNGVRNGAYKGLRAAATYFDAISYSGDDYLSVTDKWINALNEEDAALLARVREESVSKPELYRQLIDEFGGKQLPSEEKLARTLYLNPGYGILQDAAETAARVFLESVKFAGLVDAKGFLRKPGSQVQEPPAPSSGGSPNPESNPGGSQKPPAAGSISGLVGLEGLDRIEVQLVGGKRAYIFVPTPLPTREKERLKRYIDLILEPDDAEGDGSN